MADTVATDIFQPNAKSSRNTTTEAGISFTTQNANEVSHRLVQIERKRQAAFKMLLNSDPNVEDAEASNAQWQSVRALGIGGFGSVCLYRKYDGADNEIDVCAVKQQEFQEDEQYEGAILGVAREAVFQHQLNKLPDGSSTLKIRRYKYYRSGESRSYFDFCPHLDLEELRMRYRAWDTYLPELFLWHVFVALAKSAVMMEEGANPWERLTTYGWQPAYTLPRGKSFLLHFDIKPENVFLAEPPSSPNFADDPTSIYPQIKLADFGEAKLLGPWQNKPNHPNSFQSGTNGSRPPEQTLLSAQWETPLNGQRPIPGDKTDRKACKEKIRTSADGYGIRYTPKFNVWGIGKIARDLAYLSNWNSYRWLYRQHRNDPMEQERRYREYGYEFEPSGIPPQGYAPELFELIRDCMSLESTDRPTTTELLRRATAGLEECVGDIKYLKVSEDHESVKLFFRGNEINDMQLGTETFDVFTGPDRISKKDRRYLYKRLVDNRYKELKWGPLRPPYQKFRKEIIRSIEKAERKGVWPAGTGPFRYDGTRVIFLADYNRPDDDGNGPTSIEDVDIDDSEDGDDEDEDSDDSDDEEDDGDVPHGEQPGGEEEADEAYPPADDPEENDEEAEVQEEDDAEDGGDEQEDGRQNYDGGDGAGADTDAAPASSPQMRPCKHNCRDKQNCNHKSGCCRDGVVIPKKRKRG